MIGRKDTSMSVKVYRETFDDGPGGWWGWISNSQGPKRLEWQASSVTSRSPWWIDYNHAPPGAGYMHLLFCLNTFSSQSEHQRETAGDNRFIESMFSTDFTDARITFTIKGELADRGARALLLVQGSVDGIVSPWVLTGQPVEITDEWSQQTLTLPPDREQWTAFGSRHDRTDMYGTVPLERLLRNVNTNIMLVLFPLEIVPMGPLDGNPHLLRPEKDYPVWRHRLPEGYVSLDEVTVEFATRS